MRDQEWLDEALAALDLVYFDGLLAEDGVRAKWKTFKLTAGCTVITYGDYLEKNIRMNRCLADLSVPTFFVLGILFHETLHHVVGMDHDLTFELAEAQYVHHAKASVWERMNVDRLVASEMKKGHK